MTDIHRGAPPDTPGEHADLVQLLTPEGERVEHPDYALDISTRRSCAACYRDLVLVRVSTPRPPRCSARASWASGPRCWARRPPRSAPAGRCAPTTCRSPPTASTAWPGAAASTRSTLLRAVPRRRPRRLGPAGARLPPLHDRDRRPDPARHRLRHGRPARRRGTAPTTATIAYFGDGATSQGDVNEAFIFASVLHRARRLLLPEQPVGDLRAARAPDPGPAVPAGARVRLPRRAGRRQRRARRPRRHPRRAGPGPRAAAARR